MYTLWTGAKLLAVCCILRGGHVVALDEESDHLVRAVESNNATLTWATPEKSSGIRLDIKRKSEKKNIITFLSGTVSQRDPRVVPAGDRNTTLGFTFTNVNLSDAGEYLCQFQGQPCGRQILFVWGQPEKGQVVPEGIRLRCDVAVTSLPVEHRPLATKMVYKWNRTAMLPHNNTVPVAERRLHTAKRYYTPSQTENGSYFSCSGREKQLLLPWSDRSEWVLFTFYGPDQALPDERNNTSSPNVTDTGKDKVLDIDPGSPEFVIIVSLVSLVAVLILAVIIAVAILCRQKKSTECQQNVTNNHQMAAKGHEQYSDEEDSTVLVDNTEYSDNNYFGSDSGLGEYSDIREIERLRIKGRDPAPLPQDENIYELQEAVQVSDEHKAKLNNKDDEDEERIVTDIYAVPMKKGTLK